MELSPLFFRTFAVRTFLSAVIRAYAAYHIDNREVFLLALWSYVIALVYFGTEMVMFGTVRLGGSLVPTMVVAIGTPVWMVLTWEEWGW